MIEFSIFINIQIHIVNNMNLFQLTSDIQAGRQPYKHTDYMKLVRENAKALVKHRYTGLNIAIVGYKNQQVGTWDPSSCDSGLPGSEECVVYASAELASRGHKVTVYMDPPAQSIWRSPFSLAGRWLNVEHFDSINNKEYYDLVLLWRRYDVQSAKRRGRIVLFWPHDSPVNQAVCPFPRFDGLCFLSQHHKDQFVQQFNNIHTFQSCISGNGVVLNQFDGDLTKSNPHSIGYFSNYSRGLVQLVKIWPEILIVYPKATLAICYGRQTWNTMSDMEMSWLIAQIERLPNIIEHGKVGHKELAAIMMKTSIWAYPCNTTAETFCITAVKCQLAGMIPVTTRIGALDEVIHKDSYGPSNINNSDDLQSYKEALLTVMKKIDTIDRQKYIDFASQFGWKACVDKWLQLYADIKN